MGGEMSSSTDLAEGGPARPRGRAGSSVWLGPGCEGEGGVGRGGKVEKEEADVRPQRMGELHCAVWASSRAQGVLDRRRGVKGQSDPL